MTQPECETSPSENPPKSPKWLRVSSELERTLSFLYIRQNMNLIMTSFLYWRASAAVWTGRGAFSQQCHHHSCISKASLRFLPGDKRLILKQPRLTSIRQSQEWTTSINVFLFSLNQEHAWSHRVAAPVVQKAQNEPNYTGWGSPLSCCAAAELDCSGCKLGSR